MTDTQPTAEERCNCPSGSYKHSTACYERQITDLRASLRREENARDILAKENTRLRDQVIELRVALNVATVNQS